MCKEFWEGRFPPAQILAHHYWLPFLVSGVRAWDARHANGGGVVQQVLQEALGGAPARILDPCVAADEETLRTRLVMQQAPWAGVLTAPLLGARNDIVATGEAFCVLVSAGGACYIVDTHKHAQAGMFIATMDYEPVALAQFLWHTLLPELGCRPQLDLCLSVPGPATNAGEGCAAAPGVAPSTPHAEYPAAGPAPAAAALIAEGAAGADGAADAGNAIVAASTGVSAPAPIADSAAPPRAHRDDYVAAINVWLDGEERGRSCRLGSRVVPKWRRGAWQRGKGCVAAGVGWLAGSF